MNTPVLNRRRFAAGAAIAAFAPLSPFAFAQGAWPTKAVRLIVAGPPGGSADLVARLVADPLSRELGQPVIVDNRAGGAGSIAVGELMRAPRDGHTLLVGVNSLVSEIPHIVKLPFDMGKELKPLAELARGPLVLVATPGFPAKNMAELVAYAKSRPGEISYGSYSAGTMSHVLGLVLNQAAGIQLQHVAYKGSTPALTDLMGSHLPLMFDGLATSLPLIRSGKIKALGVSTPRRVPQLPDVPTFREAGYPQMEATGWMGLWSEPDAAGAAQSRVRAATAKVLADGALRTRLLEAGFEPGLARSSEDMLRDLHTDYERVGKVLQAANFKPE